MINTPAPLSPPPLHRCINTIITTLPHLYHYHTSSQRDITTSPHHHFTSSTPPLHHHHNCIIPTTTIRLPAPASKSRTSTRKQGLASTVLSEWRSSRESCYSWRAARGTLALAHCKGVLQRVVCSYAVFLCRYFFVVCSSFVFIFPLVKPRFYCCLFSKRAWMCVFSSERASLLAPSGLYSVASSLCGTLALLVSAL